MPREESITSPRCNIWWFLIIAGAVLSGWCSYNTLVSSAAASDASQVQTESKGTKDLILFRLDAIDARLTRIEKKLDQKE